MRKMAIEIQNRRCVCDVKNAFHQKQHVRPTPSIESKEKVRESKRKLMENKVRKRLTGAGSKV